MHEADVVTMKTEMEAAETNLRSGVKRKRGRPPKVSGKKKVEEDVCFICFDGGHLVLCDRRDCPKAYHFDCVNRDGTFFRSRGRWHCGWHICSNCEKSASPAQYMCYTCTFSLCKGCAKEGEFLCVRGNKGFCKTCMTTIVLIDKNEQGNSEMACFDDKNSWEYLFKDYWMDLKVKLSLTSDELAQAKNSCKGSGVLAHKEVSPGELYDANDDQGSNSEASISEKRKSKRQSKTSTKEFSSEARDDGGNGVVDDTVWASKELLDFVAHMKNGSKVVVSQFHANALLLEYVKRNNLRDPCWKNQILCDSRLENLFGKARVGHFEMFKLLGSHFLVKDDTQGGVVNTEANLLEAEDNSETLTKVGTDEKCRMCEKSDERRPNTNRDDYAAIDVHNISLLYLRRSLVEDLIEDTEKFHEKVVGSFVRVRVSCLGQKQEMHRLVQVVGIGRAVEPYNIGKRTTNVMLQILNINKTDMIPINLISNQKFSEDECKSLRESIQHVLISRMTVGEVQEKAMALHAVKFNDLLNTPEEHLHRLSEIPEVHTDPNVDLNYESEVDEAEQDNCTRPRDDVLNRKGKESISPGKEGSIANETWSRVQKNSTTPREPSRNMSIEDVWEKGNGTSCAGGRTNGYSLNQIRDSDQANGWEKHRNLVIESDSDTGTWNAQAVVISGSSSESALVSYSTGLTQLSNISETDKVWHYQDPSGKIQGPFSMVQLLKWSTISCFPANLRIWRTTKKQEDSILLTDALNEGLYNELPQYVKCANDPANRNTKFAKSDGWGSGSSGWEASTLEFKEVQTGNSSYVCDLLKGNGSDQPQVHIPHSSSVFTGTPYLPSDLNASSSLVNHLTKYDNVTSFSDLASPNLVEKCGGALIRDFEIDHFSLHSSSPKADLGNADALSNAVAYQVPSQYNMTDGPHGVVSEKGANATDAGERTNESLWNQRRHSDQANNSEKHRNLFMTSDLDTGTWNTQAVVRSGSSSESVPAYYSTGVTASSNISETYKVWHYQDPSGKIQGPFSMAQLLKWGTVSYFPANLRIWRTTEKQEDSILLTDALNEWIHNELPQWESNFPQTQKITASSDNYRANNQDVGWRDSNYSTWTQRKQRDISWILNGKYASNPANSNIELATYDGWGSVSLGLQALTSEFKGIHAGNTSYGWDSLKCNSAGSDKPQVHSPYSSLFFSGVSYRPTDFNASSSLVNQPVSDLLTRDDNMTSITDMASHNSVEKCGMNLIQGFKNDHFSLYGLSPKADLGIAGTLNHSNQANGWEKHRNPVPASDPDSATWNAQAVVISGSAPESALASQSAGVAQMSNISETDKMWHYQDASGKIQGPFSMVQLLNWSTIASFPANLRIWRTEKQEGSILLTDALNEGLHNKLPQWESSFSQTQKITASSDTNRAISQDVGWRESKNPTWMHRKQSGISWISNGKYASNPANSNVELAKSDGWDCGSSGWHTLTSEFKGIQAGNSSYGWDLLQHDSAGSDKPQVHSPHSSPLFSGMSYRPKGLKASSSLVNQPVSDLLTKDDNMTSSSDLPSPNSVKKCGRDLIQGFKNDHFSLHASSPKADLGNDGTLNHSNQVNVWEKHRNPVPASDLDTGTWNAQAVVISGSPPESAVASHSAGVAQMSNVSETDKLWHYQDASGKIQGPFSMAQLLNWSIIAFFPANLRIWRTTKEQEDSVLLTDALNEGLHNELPQWENSFSQHQRITASSENYSFSHHQRITCL